VSDWPKVRLGELGAWYGGGTPSKNRPDFWAEGTFPWLSPKDMGPETLSGTRDQITQAAVDGSAARLISANSVAVVVRSGILERKLPVAVVPFVTTINQDMRALLPGPGVSPGWVAWALRAHEQQLLDTCRKRGTTVASLEGRRLMDFSIPLPDLPMQRRIVAILEDHLSRLDAADSSALRAARMLAAARHSAVSEALDVPGRRRVALRALVSRVEAGRSFGGSARPATDDEWGIIKVSAMTWGEFRPTENKAVPGHTVDRRYEIRQGDLLVSRANTSAYVGASVLVGRTRPQLLLSDKSLRLVTRPGVDPRWLQTALSSRAVRSEISHRATGTKDSMRNISQASLLEVKVPDISQVEQTQDIERIASIFTAIDGLSQSIKLINARSPVLRRTLLTAAFSGRLARS